jgi:phosphatidylserine decarboxylase
MTETVPGWKAYLFVALQHVLPQHTLSGLMYLLARIRWRPLKDLLIGTFIRLYRIDMSQAAEPDPKAYPHFNAFFTRELRPEARPVDPDPQAVLSPVDGAISQVGRIAASRVIQAKGRDFSVEELLGGDAERARAFIGGSFATIYLAPNDYHRIHMPLDGDLLWTQHIPGRLFSVNATTAGLVPRLFARNERVACGFTTPAGSMTMVLIGAIFVGESRRSGPARSPRSRRALNSSARAWKINPCTLRGGPRWGVSIWARPWFCSSSRDESTGTRR